MEPNKFDWCAVSRRCWHSFVDESGGAHFVHPGTAVVCIATEAEPCVSQVSFDSHIETKILHLLIDTRASILLPKIDSIGMRRQNLYNKLPNGHRLIFELRFEALS